MKKLFKIIADGHVTTKLGRQSFTRKDAEEYAKYLQNRGYTTEIVPDKASHESSVKHRAPAWKCPCVACDQRRRSLVRAWVAQQSDESLVRLFGLVREMDDNKEIST